MTPAQEKLVLDHYGLAYAFALSYARTRNYDYDEAVSTALESLVVSALKFDPTRGVAFRSWMMMRVVNAIIDDVRKRHGRGSRRREPDTSLSFVVAEDDHGNTVTLGDVIADSRSVDPQQYVELMEALRAFAVLSPRQREVLTRCVSGEPQKDIAADLGVTEGRISQVRREASRRLQAVCG